MKNSFFILVSLLFLTLNANCQEPEKKEANSIYLVCRGTKSKINIVARDFNLKDSLLTHIGIGFIEDNQFLVYNVSNFKKNTNGSSLIKESLESFVNLDDIVYYSVWKIQSNEEEINKLKTIVSEFEKRTINFDYSFELKEDDYYYCSEFVYEVLKKLNSSKYNFSPTTITLNSFYSKALKKEKFDYIPVDFFLTDNLFKKVEERQYKITVK